MAAAATRSVILDAAVELGSLRGLEDLSMGGLASAVEMSKSGLFAHFGSKQELQLATVAQAWEVFEAEVLLDPPADANGGLHGLVERWLSFYERRVFAGGCFFVVAAVEVSGQRGKLREALAEAVDAQIAALESAIDAARASGELTARGEPDELAYELHSILVGADHLFQVREDPVVFERARAAVARLLDER